MGVIRSSSLSSWAMVNGALLALVVGSCMILSVRVLCLLRSCVLVDTTVLLWFVRLYDSDAERASSGCGCARVVSMA